MLLTIFTFLGNLILFLLVLSLVICIHELGHLYFAKKAGILCHEYAFGMGPRLWSKKVGETVYSIRAIPFGGFVSMAGEEIESDIIKLNQKIRLGFDDAGNVNRIIINVENPEYQDFIEVTVEQVDLKGMNDSSLYINEYTVNRDAFYVFDKNQIQIAPHDRVFGSKSLWHRFKVTFGGPLMNLILAMFIYLVLAFSLGVPNPDSTVISAVIDNAPASGILLPNDEILKINGVDITAWSSEDNASVNSELAKYLENDTFIFTVKRDGEIVTLDPIKPQIAFYGLGFISDPESEGLTIVSPLYTDSELLPGDVIVSIDGTNFTSWDDVIDFANTYPGSYEDDPTVIVVLRDGVSMTFSYIAYEQHVLDVLGYPIVASRIGIVGSTHFSFFGGIANAGESFYNDATSIYGTLGLLFTSEQVTISKLQGFIGIFSITSNAASAGFFSLLAWVALLSVNLGVVNLLPIPALDGGRIAFLAVEAITKKKVKPSVENTINTVAFFLLIGLLLYVTFNDIMRLF